jgi:hypothetical protein
LASAKLNKNLFHRGNFGWLPLNPRPAVPRNFRWRAMLAIKPYSSDTRFQTRERASYA